MGEIIANATLGLLMILFQEADPIFTVLVLRFAICAGALGGIGWLAAKVVKAWRDALK